MQRGEKTRKKWADLIHFHLSLSCFFHMTDNALPLSLTIKRSNSSFFSSSFFFSECVLELIDDKRGRLNVLQGHSWALHPQGGSIVPGIAAQQGGKDATPQWWAKLFNKPNITEENHLKSVIFSFSCPVRTSCISEEDWLQLKLLL